MFLVCIVAKRSVSKSNNLQWKSIAAIRTILTNISLSLSLSLFLIIFHIFVDLLLQKFKDHCSVGRNSYAIEDSLLV